METLAHTGQRLKSVIREYNLSDQTITSLTPFEQSYLSKIYTSRDIQPRQLQNFLYVINKVFDLEISSDSILSRELFHA